ncbi:MAG: thymidine kinase [Patescibacteria group bacterium]|nr:thymidine kinase [Patescibacteria group bacterium]
MKNQGKLIAIAGCMFSGKNRLAHNLVQNFKEQGLTSCFFKASCDQRGGKNIIIRGLGQVSATIIDDRNPEQILSHAQNEVIVIDEGQFFNQKIIGVLEELRKRGKIVVVIGLDTNFKGEPFHPMPEIIAIADERFFPQMARCAVCGQVASRTQKLNLDGTPAGHNSPLIDSGGEHSGDRYEPRCRSCYQPPQ